MADLYGFKIKMMVQRLSRSVTHPKPLAVLHQHVWNLENCSGNISVLLITSKHNRIDLMFNRYAECFTINTENYWYISYGNNESIHFLSFSGFQLRSIHIQNFLFKYIIILLQFLYYFSVSMLCYLYIIFFFKSIYKLHFAEIRIV